MSKLNPRMAANYRRGFGPRRMVLLLTTRGRKSGLPRVTPLQYEHWNGVLWVASARGAEADWFCNLVVDPHVEVEMNGEHFSGQAQAIADPIQIADFLQMRLQRHPWMMGVLMRLEGLPLRYTRRDLERFAAEKAMAAIHLDEAEAR